MNIGRKFLIKLNPSEYAEHRTAELRENNGKECTLVEHLFSSLYVTDLPVPEGTPDSHYARGGKLVIMFDKDGFFL